LKNPRKQPKRASPPPHFPNRVYTPPMPYPKEVVPPVFCGVYLCRPAEIPKGKKGTVKVLWSKDPPNPGKTKMPIPATTLSVVVYDKW